MQRNGILLWVLLLVSTAAIGQTYQDRVVRVKVSEELAAKLSSKQIVNNEIGIAVTADASINWSNRSLETTSFKRLFPDAGKFEKRHRAHGLHLWYELKFKNKGEWSLDKVINQYLDHRDVVMAEPVYLKSIEAGKQPIKEGYIPVSFNDVQYAGQWHYNNTGQTAGTTDADIDLPEAWDISTGSDQVIVAIIDTGVDLDHVDLVDNIWENTLEVNGLVGVDDDGNGYIDDFHGYSFPNNTGNILPGQHGTHVAGTVGAVNNNGIGVSGVAGGDGTNPGVKMMNCAVFTAAGNGGFGEALVYAADNGAVIAQNSWGYTSPGVYEQSTLDGIDYFVENAGYDENGLPVGPMQGGLVTFASGNSNSSLDYYPAAYAAAMSVASTTHEDIRAYYSVYNDKVDIAAPGGETIHQNVEGVLSTLANDQYGYKQGTSMATPHVSGVAALVVAEFGGVGFTKEQLWDKLVYSTDNIDALNPGFVGMLGTGRLNAHSALTLGLDVEAPELINDLAIAGSLGNVLELHWTKPNDNRRVMHYEIRWANAMITEANFNGANLDTVLLAQNDVSDEVYFMEDLSYSQQHYIAIKAFDNDGNESLISNVVAYESPGPPTFAIDLVDFNTSLHAWDSLLKSTIIQNTGSSALLVDVENEFISATLGGAGGGHGYTWSNNLEAGGPAYEWVEIQSNGQRVDLRDDGYFSVPLPFEFMLFGREHSDMLVSSNGLIGFDPESFNSYNGQIPSAAAPNALVAVLWHDLNPEFGGTIYYKVESDRVVVTWEAVKDWDSNVPFTFQAILYANGNIQSNYKQVNTVRNDGLAIENHNGSKSVVTSSGASSLPNAYTVLMESPRWFVYGLPTEQLVLEPSEQFPLELKVKSQNLLPGSYVNKIHFSNNATNAPEYSVEVELEVLPTPLLVASKSAMDMDTVFLGYTQVDSVLISNHGNAALNITQISIEDPQFVANFTSLDLAPGASQYVRFEYAPTSVGIHDTELIFTSNSHLNGVVTIPIEARSEIAPSLVLPTNAVSILVNQGAVAHEEISIENQLGGVLKYKLEEKPLHSEGMDGSYSWRSIEYAWVGIEGAGTEIPLFDDDFETIPLPFAFNFYGNIYTSVAVGDNGLVGFSGTGYDTPVHQSLPDPTGANNLIAPLWTDFDPSSGGTVHYVAEAEKMTIQYTNMRPFLKSEEFTFQVVLFASGKIEMVYKEVDFLNEFSMGLENVSGTDGILMAYNEGSALNSATAYRIETYDTFISNINPDAGEIEGVGGAAIQLQVDAGSLNPGTYTSYVEVKANDPENQQDWLAVHLTVDGDASIRVDPVNYDFGTVYIRDTAAVAIVIYNDGPGVLDIYDVQSANTSLQFELGQEQIAAGSSAVLTAKYIPVSLAPLSAAATINNDDPVNHALELSFVGTVLPRAEIQTETIQMPDTVMFDSEVVVSIEVSNLGSLELGIASVVVLDNFGVEMSGWSFNWTQAVLQEATTKVLDLRIPASAFESGIFKGNVVFESNDPVHPIWKQPLEWLVCGYAGNLAPELTTPTETQYVQVDLEQYILDLNNYVKDSNGDALHFETKVENPDIVEVEEVEGVLNISPKMLGNTYIEVKVTDAGCLTLAFQVKVVVAEVTGMHANMKNSNWALYPNPTAGIATIQRPEFSPLPVYYEMLNLQGQQIQFQNIQLAPHDTTIELNVSGVKNGIYLINIRLENGSVERFRVRIER